MNMDDYKLFKRSLRCHWLYSLKNDVERFWREIDSFDIEAASNDIHFMHMELNVRYGEKVADNFVKSFFDKCFKLTEELHKSKSHRNQRNGLALSFAILRFINDYCTLTDGGYVIN